MEANWVRICRALATFYRKKQWQWREILNGPERPGGVRSRNVRRTRPLLQGACNFVRNTRCVNIKGATVQVLGKRKVTEQRAINIHYETCRF